jgi:hypothetical protein
MKAAVGGLSFFGGLRNGGSDLSARPNLSDATFCLAAAATLRLSYGGHQKRMPHGSPGISRPMI